MKREHEKYLEFFLLSIKYCLVPLVMLYFLIFVENGFGWIVVLGIPALILYVLIWFIKLFINDMRR